MYFKKNRLISSNNWAKFIPISSLLLLMSCSQEENLTEDIGALSELNISSKSIEIPVSSIIADTEQSENPASNAIDDSSSSRWSGFGDDVNLTLDLGSSNLIDYVNISFYNGDIRTSSFEVYTSSDNSTYTLINSKTSSGDSENLETFDLNDTGANYIRFKFSGNSINAWNSITDIEIYGTPGEGVVIVDTDCVSAFSISLDASDCTIDIQDSLGVDSIYEETVDGTVRTITVNDIPSHLIGEFPTQGNPNTVAEIGNTYTMTTEPTLADRVTSTAGHVSGVLFSGVGLEVQTAESFVTSDGEANRDWSIVALQSTDDLGLDCNNAHVQPTGQYHYHGAPAAYISDLGIDGTEMIKLGYAGDGFPIYYKYGYADDGVTLVSFESGYSLIDGDRGGDGVSAPDGCYDGTYSQDYEYVDGSSELDQCNGRTGKTPDSDSEYYYIMSDNWPSAPICFSGDPDDSFRFGGGGGDEEGEMPPM